MPLSKFSENVKKLRIQKGIKQAELAAVMEVSVRTIAFYESGERHPDFDGLIRMADYFQVSLDYLTGRSDS